MVNKIFVFSTQFSSKKVFLPTFPRICRQNFSFAKVTPVYTQFLDSRAKLSFQITWRVLPPQWRNNFSNNWILHWDCYDKNVKWIISRQRAKSVQHHNKRWLKPIRGLPGLCVLSTVAMRKAQNISWGDHATLERIYGILIPLSLRLKRRRL